MLRAPGLGFLAYGEGSIVSALGLAFPGCWLAKHGAEGPLTYVKDFNRVLSAPPEGSWRPRFENL